MKIVSKRVACVRRRGSLYIAVVGVSLIVSVIAFAAAHVAQMNIRNASGQKDREQARLLALAAIEHAITEFNINPNWQTDYVWDTEYPLTPVSVNGGTFTWRLTDLGDGKRRLDGIGRAGDAQFVQSVNLGASSAESLQCAMFAGNRSQNRSSRMSRKLRCFVYGKGNPETSGRNPRRCVG